MNRPAIICPGCHQELQSTICQCGRPLQLSGHWESFKSGQEHWNAKLSDHDIEAIRRDNRTPTEIAASYNIHPSTVSRYKTGSRRRKDDATQAAEALGRKKLAKEALEEYDKAGYTKLVHWLREQANGQPKETP